jgi:hypothetical protein
MIWMEKGGMAWFGWLKGARLGWYGFVEERSLHVPDTSAISGTKFVINWIGLYAIHSKLYLQCTVHITGQNYVERVGDY